MVRWFNLCIWSVLLFVSTLAMAQDDVRKPIKDASGRFYVYRNADTPMFFTPYFFMPKEMAAPEKKYMNLDLGCKETPHVEAAKAPASKQEKEDKPSNDKSKDKEEETCIKFTATWHAPNWCAVGFISGSDSPPWTGEDAQGGRWYDLSGLSKKRLVFWARGVTGDERLQMRVGILQTAHGDSLTTPAQSKWVKLTKEWAQFEVDLSKCQPETLRRICSVALSIARVQQEDPFATSTTVYLDDIYFE